MTEQHYFANDGSNWTTPPSPVNANEAREADKAIDEQAAEGDGFSATNETQLHRTIVEDSNASNPAGADEPRATTADEDGDDEDEAPKPRRSRRKSTDSE